LIDRGIQINSNDEHSENAFASIRVSFDPDSNVNDKTESQDKKERSPRNSTEAGRQIDFNDEHSENA
jgi:hypothetical protein